MRLSIGAVIVLSFLLATGLVLAQDAGPKVGELTGEATYLPGSKGEPKPLAKGDSLKQGDDVTLADGAKMKVELPSGASMEVTGPANFALQMVSDYAWTVDLRSGTIDHLVAKDYFTGVTTPSDVFMALRNGDVSVSVDSSGGIDAVTLVLNEGDEAKVVQGEEGEAKNLVVGEAMVFESPSAAGDEEAGGDDDDDSMEGAEDEGADEGDGGEEAEENTGLPSRPPTAAQIVIGVHEIYVDPKDSFRIRPTPSGGWILACVAPEGEYAQVTIDGDVNFFLTNGDEIEFDSLGNVIRHDAIVHVYAALNVRGIYDEAVANPNDASFVGKTSE